MRVLSLFAFAAPLVSAIQFQEPFANSTLKKGETYSVKWSSVDTDPTVFSIFLVNFVDWPPFYTQVASDVPTSEGEHQVTVPCDVNSSWGFQFNAINGTNVFVIHAQTPKFSIRDGDCNGAGPITPPDESSCHPVTVTETATTTVTVSPTCSVLPPSSEESATTVSVVPSVEPSAPSASIPSNPEPTEGSEDAAEPTVTSPPVVGGADDGSGEDAITSTVYSTVYRDLSEVEDCAELCSA
ncbi:Ser-Thr-rich glycosyl-phosphatidyl-inositol-anchored membrane family-domain-containing protein [Chaetomium tenue]|uniref:Ser-Thr-rich glycosyl-phosphatidyl-inositol-anchored membrane family-domain-containing protein n=1 Tax=Chaetomium tenue TaxID=1854479 RepID=A0ACB7PSF8_9PEZI|nr:Ser-Thr-rich glycosyl-phosphatidyl-inositol-anchored membrane family-domain-containing protein [Chaetomium globosum]